MNNSFTKYSCLNNTEVLTLTAIIVPVDFWTALTKTIAIWWDKQYKQILLVWQDKLANVTS